MDIRHDPYWDYWYIAEENSLSCLWNDGELHLGTNHLGRRKGEKAHGSWETKQEAEEFLKLYERGKMNVNTLIQRLEQTETSLNRIKDDIEDLKKQLKEKNPAIAGICTIEGQRAVFVKNTKELRDFLDALQDGYVFISSNTPLGCHCKPPSSNWAEDIETV